MTIILGSDFSPSTRSVDETAARFAQRRNEELVVANVARRVPSKDDASALTLEHLKHLKPFVDKVRPTTLVGDTVGTALARLADDERASLLFVGASDGFLASPLGSVAAVAVRTGSVPVFVVRKAMRASIERLRVLAVLALDETDVGIVEAIDALMPVAEHIDLVVVHYRAGVDHDEVERHSAMQLAGRDVESTLAALHPPTNRCALESIVIRDPRGDLAKDVAHLVREKSIDLVVCGSHHRHGAQRVLEGSVAERIVNACPVNVLVGRAPQRT